MSREFSPRETIEKWVPLSPPLDPLLSVPPTSSFDSPPPFLCFLLSRANPPASYPITDADFVNAISSPSPSRLPSPFIFLRLFFFLRALPRGVLSLIHGRSREMIPGESRNLVCLRFSNSSPHPFPLFFVDPLEIVVSPLCWRPSFRNCGILNTLLSVLYPCSSRRARRDFKYLSQMIPGMPVFFLLAPTASG